MTGQSNIEKFLSLLESNDTKEVVKALQFLAGNPHLVDNSHIILRLEKIASSGDISCRFWAKKLLNESGKYRFNKPTQVSSPDNASNISKELPIEILVQKLQSIPSTFVSLDLIKRLCESKKPEALDYLVKYLNTCQDVIQISYLTKNIGVFYPQESNLQILIPFLKHSDTRIVANTLEGIEMINSSKSVVIYSQMLEHHSNRVRGNAAKALAAHDPQQAFLILEKMLSPKSGAHFKISACHAVRALRQSRFIPLLEPLLYDDLTFTYALSAVDAIGGKSAIDLLTRLYSSFDQSKQEFVDEIITGLVEKQKKSIPTALRNTSDTSSNNNHIPSGFSLQNFQPRKPVIKEDEIFCPKCGNPFKESLANCPNCRQKNPLLKIEKPEPEPDPKPKKRIENGIYCSSCGETIKREAEICIHCGVRVKPKVSTPPPLKPSMEQKSPLIKAKSANEIYCPNCGKLVHKDAEICVSCGIRIKKDKPSEQKNNSRGRHSGRTFLSQLWCICE